ncbi:hypothetical protein [Adlercreutzia shanghongiae]|uniref:Uncharacterized protein n=1 Tax=Adlercreutzia shanghongiae TaxID=3111773 RepID=A0ABU6IW41_9ACTN|nr:hypothetical protein [Adlercreutzia sp. R22]MEC4294051.1 hypothetical protein [Adlercreutzia sp. R22]
MAKIASISEVIRPIVLPDGTQTEEVEQVVELASETKRSAAEFAPAQETEEIFRALLELIEESMAPALALVPGKYRQGIEDAMDKVKGLINGEEV